MTEDIINDKINNKMILYHGDSSFVLNDIPENSVDIVLTDPPYQVFNKIQWDIMPSVDLFRKILRVMKPNTPAFVMSSPRQDLYVEMITRMKEAGFNIRYNSIYWLYNTSTIKGYINKEKGYITGLNYRNSTEVIIVASKPVKLANSQDYGSFQSPKHQKYQQQQLITNYYNTEPIYPSSFILDANPVVGLSKSTIQLHSLDTWWDSVFLDIPKPSRNELTFIKRKPDKKYRGMFMNSRTDIGDKDNHLTVKPVKLFTYILATFSSSGKTVLDPFCGTGTIFPAARNVNMSAVGIEFQSEYIDIIKKRMQMENIEIEVREAV
ncbi:MAG: DNA methyltransferase [Candidatus Micrarchaeaceae archaeon]